MAGIYIHIPFCRKACFYCNFHFSTNTALQNDFVGALLKEMELRKDYLGGETVETIYLGGGTPSLLPPESIRDILLSLYQHFQISPSAEITLEANPDDMKPERLASWKEMGINRLSIGIQSFFEEDLVWMNRAHHADQALIAAELARTSGFDQFSIDLIYGFPGLSDEKWRQNLHNAILIHPDHISCYALTVEPKTALDKMIREKRSPAVDPDKQAAQYLTGITELENAGYEHYEISSFSLPGKRSRHNSAYWSSKKYLGLGPSAHSFDGVSRQWNVANNAVYIKGQELTQNLYKSDKELTKSLYKREILSEKDHLNEYIMTSLRTSDGLDLEYILERFGMEKKETLDKNSLVYIVNRQMEKKEKRLVLTREGKLFADGIAADLFFN